MDLLTDYGLVGLLISSFLAATVLPFSSAALLGYLLLSGYQPIETVLFATVGNVAGSVVNYWLGVAGTVFVLKKFFRVSVKDLEAAGKRFKKYGAPSLLFAWVPIIGDPLTVAAGILKINFILFLVLVTIGKLFRYIILAYMVLGV